MVHHPRLPGIPAQVGGHEERSRHQPAQAPRFPEGGTGLWRRRGGPRRRLRGRARRVRAGRVCGQKGGRQQRQRARDDPARRRQRRPAHPRATRRPGAARPAAQACRTDGLAGAAPERSVRPQPQPRRHQGSLGQGQGRHRPGRRLSNPTFSHFESIRIWETGDPTRRQVDGWLGRTLATSYDSNGHPLTGCACGATDAPGALRDLQATLTVIQNQKTFGFTGGTEVEAAVGALYKATPGIYGALFDTAIATATETMATLRTSASTYHPMADYTDQVKLVYSSKNQLAAALQLAAELIVTGTGVKLLHVTLGGFDTHYTELNRHDDLMGYLDSAVSAFYKDLAAHNMADKVLIATWSEFGRRPKENASGGTDHGAAAPLLLIGDPVNGGLYGAEPSLTSLDNTGNLKYSVDFRSVYQEILSGHLGADAPKILGSSFDRIPFLKAPVVV
ncbi:MAG: DUF1501 domain-containing protein [Chloroflexi bacterium]|nr:MAG: DUF1501 domain-containing protein [Chloroflexota bacterium]